jgi:hypothetical protein
MSYEEESGNPVVKLELIGCVSEMKKMHFWQPVKMHTLFSFSFRNLRRLLGPMNFSFSFINLAPLCNAVFLHFFALFHPELYFLFLNHYLFLDSNDFCYQTKIIIFVLSKKEN